MMKPAIDKVVGGVLLAGFLAGMVGYGGGKTNSVPPNLNAPFAPMGEVHPLQGLARLIWPEAFDPRILSQQLQLADAEKMASNWNARGAWRDSFRLDFDEGWVFPWGTNHLTSVEVLSHGEIRPQWNDTNVVARLGAPVSIVPGLTTFAYEFTPSNSYRFVWTDAALNRDTNNLVSAALELFRSGDVMVTTNGVAALLPRELPFAHDGFGQDAEWVAANFTNVTEITAVGGYAAWVDAQVGEGLTNGLYKLTVLLANTPPEVVNLTVGDWSVAVTNVGECVFLLEKGTRYEIGLSYFMDGFSFDCDDGMEVATPRLLRGPVNSPAYSVLLTSSCDEGGVELVEPSPSGDGYVIYSPWLSLAPSEAVDPTFPLLLSASVFDLPQGAYPTVEWQTNDGTIATGENFFWYGDEDIDSIDVVATCRDAILHGHYSIERHVRTSEIALSGGGLIIVEDAYTNAPGEIVAASSTSVGLDLSWALAEEGTLTLESNSAAFALTNEYGTTFSLPCSWHGSVDEEDECWLFASCTDTTQTGHVGDFVFTFTPDAPTAATLVRTVGVDVVKIRVEAEADWPSNKVRHVFGVNERCNVIIEPGGILLETNAPPVVGAHVLLVNVSGREHSLVIQSIAPADMIEFSFVREMTAADWDSPPLGKLPLAANTPGAGYVATRTLMPSYVNFKNILIMEGFATMTNQTGCFTNTVKFPPSIYGHGSDAGAGIVAAVDSVGNQISGIDRIGVQFDQYPDYNGSYSLPIPVYWGIDAASCSNRFSTSLMQVTATVVPDGDDGAYLDTTVSKGNTNFTRRCPDER